MFKVELVDVDYKMVAEMKNINTNVIITKDGVFVFVRQKMTDGMPVFQRMDYESIGMELKQV